MKPLNLTTSSNAFIDSELVECEPVGLHDLLGLDLLPPLVVPHVGSLRPAYFQGCQMTLFVANLDGFFGTRPFHLPSKIKINTKLTLFTSLIWL